MTDELQAENKQLREQIDTCRELRKYDRAELERCRAAIAHVRQRSARACEILNEFDNTYQEKKP